MERLSIAESLRRKDKRRRRGWTVVVGNEIRWVEHKSAMLQLFSAIRIKIRQLLSGESNSYFRASQLPRWCLYYEQLGIITFVLGILIRSQENFRSLFLRLCLCFCRVTRWFYYVCHVRDRIMFWLKNCLKSKRIDESSMSEFCCTLWHAVIIFFSDRNSIHNCYYLIYSSWIYRGTVKIRHIR